MKIKKFNVSYAEACAIKMPEHKDPNKPNIFFRTLLKIVSLPDLIATRFSYKKIDMEKAARHLARSGYKGSVMLEVRTQNVKLTDPDEFYSKARAAAVRFAEAVERYKKEI